ncbi:UDP-N-acetylglucosamine 1-carboxyvinyltransferase [Candidatus Poribacteria bacterium]|nr:UDP-N-acetylglucosamine 1-carboxyvinyltransferase [Candidatus Poribacteria bacterium]
MDKLLINGGKKLKGTIDISGSKNAALPIIVAAGILGQSKSIITNVPHLTDVKMLCSLLEKLGAKTHLDNNQLTIEPIDQTSYEAPYDLVRKMRASIYVLGPLLARMGRAKVSFPGGCAIGPRPIDLHLEGLKRLGAKIEVLGGYIDAHADSLQGTDVYLKGIFGASVGATANVMMAATLGQGTTTIRPAACEPHITDLARFLIKMGASIEGVGTTELKIHGVNSLNGTHHSVLSDDIETGTFMVAAAMTKGDLFLKGANRAQVQAVTEKLVQVGVKMSWQNDGVRIWVDRQLNPTDVRTDVYPGFPTDMQAQIMGLLSLVSGVSVITETIHQDRFMHVAELNRLGANIRVDGNMAVIHGVRQLSGAPVMASDLRAGIVLVLSGLAAQGQTLVSRVYHIDRGYEKVEAKLSAVGADIRRLNT